MNEAAYDQTRKLAARGYVEVEAQCGGGFGSWSVTIDHMPRIRVLWDGKDSELAIQWETTAVWNGLTRWETLWLAREPLDQAPGRVADAFDSICRFALASRP